MRIMIGMSGGVDSSVSALLLKKAGFDVSGVTMILKPLDILSEEEKKHLYDDASDAAAVCEKLGIEHFAPDLSEEFRNKVIDYFVSDYFSARTPNPCVQCNINLKFGKMLDFALEHGYDHVATGHYAKIEERDGRFLLKRADTRKDQSYFLYGLSQFQLAHAVFPLHDIDKPEARKIAAEAGLPVAERPDSQEICFIKNNNYIDFIERCSERTAEPGNFVDTKGNVLGRHSGIYKYTIGQRKGLGITFGEPRFVTSINAAENTVTLGPEGSQYRNRLEAENCNFISIPELTSPMEAEVKVRYQAKPAKALISPLPGGKVCVEFEEAQRSVTPGQAVVFYDGDVVIGGGTII